jgi:Cu(I)/Ag(I) efflux system membrane fusion protein
LIRGGKVDRVVLAEGDGRYRSHPVVPGFESGDRVEIQSGVAADDRVVISGQFLIDSESNIGSALMRLEGQENSMPNSMDHAAPTDEPPTDHSTHTDESMK